MVDWRHNKLSRYVIPNSVYYSTSRSLSDDELLKTDLTIPGVVTSWLIKGNETSRVQILTATRRDMGRLGTNCYRFSNLLLLCRFNPHNSVHLLQQPERTTSSSSQHC